jgi:hypothetical protein
VFSPQISTPIRPSRVSHTRNPAPSPLAQTSFSKKVGLRELRALLHPHTFEGLDEGLRLEVERLGPTPEELAQAAVVDLLATRDDDFGAAAKRLAPSAPQASRLTLPGKSAKMRAARRHGRTACWTS